MGVIKREGLKQSVVTYIGVMIGAVNTLYFYPKFFSEEELGLFRFLLDTSALLFPFISLGIHNLSVRMFPKFKNAQNGHNGLWFFLLTGVLIGYGLFYLLAQFVSPSIDGLFIERSALFQDHWKYVIILSGFIVLGMISTQYILNFKKVLIPAIVNDLFIKIGLPLIAILCFYKVLSILQGIYFLIAVYATIVAILFGYIVYIKQWHFKPNWQFLKKPLLKEMGEFSFYGVLGSLGSVMANRIDILMIALLASNDLKDVGVYSIAFFIANVITVPARAINNISSPVIASAWNNSDLKNLKDVYSKSSLVLLTFGLLCLIGIWASIDDLFTLMPNGEKYAAGKYVILILGLGKLFDLANGNNGQIIGYSKHFRFNFYAVLILAVVNVISNYVLIPIYQINGAALATASSIFVFNLSKTAFAHFKMGLHPFSAKTIQVILLGLIVYLLSTVIPASGIPLIDIIIRSVLIAVTYLGAVVSLNVSPDISDLFWQVVGGLGISKPK